MSMPGMTMTKTTRNWSVPFTATPPLKSPVPHVAAAMSANSTPSISTGILTNLFLRGFQSNALLL